MARALLLLVTALLALLLAGCTGAGESAAGSGAGGGADTASASEAASAVEGGAAEDGAVEDGAVEGGPAEQAAAAAAAPAVPSGRQVITTGDVTVTVADPRSAVQQVIVLVEGRGGRVDERVEQGAVDADGAGGPATRASASLVVRVPAGEVTAVLDALEDVGEVGSVSLTSSDVTTQARDLDARISALTTSTARLERLIAAATTTADVIAAEQALSDRQASLESLVAERASLAEQVDLSTLRIGLTSEGPAAPAAAVGPGGFLGGLTTGWESLARAVGGLLVVAGVLLPWAVVFAVLVAGAVAVHRALHRRRSTAATSA